MAEDLRTDVNRLKRAVFGDDDDRKETPGVIAELAQMNLTMTEMKDALKRINWTILTAFLTALCVLVFKGLTFQ